VDLAGVASFHGALATENPAQPGAVKAKVMVFNGADESVLPSDGRSAPITRRARNCSCGAERSHEGTVRHESVFQWTRLFHLTRLLAKTGM